MIDSELANLLAIASSFSDEAIHISLPDHIPLKKVMVDLEGVLASWAKSMHKEKVVIKNSSGKAMEIPSSWAITSDVPVQSNLLWFANVAIAPNVLAIANSLMENPRRAGVTRLADELQIIMSDACGVLNPGHTLQEATNWKRHQFWHPQDLIDFRVRIREMGDRSFDYTWRSFDPTDPTKTCDLRFTTRYKLFEGGDGEYYQLCENLDMQLI